MVDWQLLLTIIIVALAIGWATVMAVRSIRRNLQCRDIRCAGCQLNEVCKKAKRRREEEKVKQMFGGNK